MMTLNNPFLLEGDDNDDDDDDDDDDDNNNNNNNNCVFRTGTSVDVLGKGRILKLSKLPVFIKLVAFSSTVRAASLDVRVNITADTVGHVEQQ
jgi:hypothetical protein